MAACSPNSTTGASATGHGGAGGQEHGSTGPGGGTGFGGSPNPQGPFADFPSDPILDTPMGGMAPPPNAADLFGPPDTGAPTGGPCLSEPEPGTLFPSNWLRPRFQFTPAAGQNLFEIRIKAKNEINDLVVYTTATEWKMPLAMWSALSYHIVDAPITVTIRGAVLQGNALLGPPTTGTSGDIRIAPATASGAIVYWRTSAAQQTGELKGFSVGDESVVSALRSDQVQTKLGGQSVSCIGCHASTPDGQYAAFKTHLATEGGALASLNAATVGAPPPFWSMASINSMSTADFGVPTFSKAHWMPSDHTLVTSLGNGNAAKLAWFDLEANTSGEGQSYGYLDRTGDTHGAILPAWSHDGQKIVYMSTDSSVDGRPTAGSVSDLFMIPFAGRKGGAATPIAGAAEPNYTEYYPAISPDDQLIAFNRIGSGVEPYDQPAAEVFVIPTGGGAPTRLAANDPSACTGKKSPGVTNSWPKWAPEAVTVGDRTFYWLTFSSRRLGGLPQLYVTAVVVQNGTITSYPALYLWNQPSDEPNHTPAWDVFDIPSIPK